MKEYKVNEEVVVSATATGLGRPLRGKVSKVETSLNATFVSVDYTEAAPDGSKGIVITNLSLLRPLQSVKIYDTRREISYFLEFREDGQIVKERVTPDGEEVDPEANKEQLQTYDNFTELLIESLAPTAVDMELRSIEVDLQSETATAEIDYKAKSGSVIDLPPELLRGLATRWHLTDFSIMTGTTNTSIMIEIEI